MKLYTTKIRLYPTEPQKQQLSGMFGSARWVYNNALDFCQKQYRETGKTPNYHELAIRLPKLKQEFEWLKENSAQVLQMSIRNLAVAYEKFFLKKAQYPVFKSKFDRQSINFPQSVSLTVNRIKLPKIGLVKAKVHRDVKGRIKTVTVSKDSCNHYYASILSETDESIPEPHSNGKAIGIDLGLTHFVITSEGSKYANPKIAQRVANRIKVLSQSLARKKKGSNNREKAKLLLAKAHKKIANMRADFLHKLSHKLVDENQVIITESLAVKNMMKCRTLSKAISDASWGSFTAMLKYKALRLGKTYLSVDRFFPSSKTCSSCGYAHKGLKLNNRNWTCPSCSAVHDRDVNAAMNIKQEGLRILAVGMPVNTCGETIRPKQKVISAKAVSMKQEAPSFRAE